MRIILDFDWVRPKGQQRKRIRIRTKYYFNTDDLVQVQNCGVEIYNLICGSIDAATSGGIIEHKGEQK